MSSRPNVAVLLAGCGASDGSDVQEAVLVLLALDRHGAAWQCFAPDLPQHHVIDHVTGQEVEGVGRNTLVESARLGGTVKNLAAFRPAQVDALLIPGGFGLTTTMSSFAFDGPDCMVLPALERAVRGMVQAGKPVGAMGLAAAVAARILGDVRVTVGTDAGLAAAIATMGGRHAEAAPGDVVVDEKAGLVTTPGALTGAPIAQVADGVDALVRAVLALARQPQAA